MIEVRFTDVCESNGQVRVMVLPKMFTNSSKMKLINYHSRITNVSGLPRCPVSVFSVENSILVAYAKRRIAGTHHFSVVFPSCASVTKIVQ